jgi:cyclophilin family peptidyl-prolyl cis-trans isomerase
MVAAGRLGAAGVGIAIQGLKDRSASVRQAAFWAACHGGAGAFGPVKQAMARERDVAVLETLLANLWRFGDAGWISLASPYATHNDAFLRRAAAYSLSRTGVEQARAAQRTLAGDEEPVIRATALRGFARGTLETADVAVLTKAIGDGDWRVRSAAYGAISAHDGLELPSAAGKTIAADFSSNRPQLAAAALAAAVRHSTIGTLDEILTMTAGDDSWLAGEALAVLANRDREAAAKIAAEWMASQDAWRQRAAARVSVELGADLEKTAASSPDAGVRLAWLGALDEDRTIGRKAQLLELLTTDPDPAVRAQLLSLLSAADAAPGNEKLIELHTAWKTDRMPDARVEALAIALAKESDEGQRAQILEIGLADPDSAAVALLVAGARRLDIEVELPAREARHGTRWYEGLVEWTTEERWLDVATERGVFRIALDLDAAPLSAREISDLAEDGFYDGLSFHRVVPNFVVQGGDPRGDGWGGPGFALPDEASLQPFDSWRVGIATSGPQTGGCQLFVTLMPADHLTGHYTNIGEVVEGREVLAQLRVGDTITSIIPRSGAEPPALK